MQQIGNVFYNLLNLLGQKNQDERMIGLSKDLRDMIQSRRFDNLFEGNVPFAGMEKINLLKTHDLSVQDQAHLIKSGLGDLLNHPSNRVLSSAIIKDDIDDLNKVVDHNDDRIAVLAAEVTVNTKHIDDFSDVITFVNTTLAGMVEENTCAIEELQSNGEKIYLQNFREH